MKVTRQRGDRRHSVHAGAITRITNHVIESDNQLFKKSVKRKVINSPSPQAFARDCIEGVRHITHRTDIYAAPSAERGYRPTSRLIFENNV